MWKEQANTNQHIFVIVLWRMNYDWIIGIPSPTKCLQKIYEYCV